MSANQPGKLAGKWHSTWQTNSKEELHSWTTEQVELQVPTATTIELGTIDGTNNNNFSWEGEGNIQGDEFISGIWWSRNHPTSQGTFILWKHTKFEHLAGFFLGTTSERKLNYGAWIMAEREEDLGKGKELLARLCPGWTDFILLAKDESLPTTASIKKNVPQCDEAVIQYLDECLTCLRFNAIASATFMLGAASEIAINRLIEGYSNAIKDSTKRDQFMKPLETERSIKNRFEMFAESYEKSKTYKEAKKKVNFQWSLDRSRTIFDALRLARNDIGHPTSPAEFERDYVTSQLAQVTHYLKHIYEMIKYFQKEGIEL